MSYKIVGVQDQGDGYLVEIRLGPESKYVEGWTYEAMGKYLDGMAKDGRLSVGTLSPMDGDR